MARGRMRRRDFTVYLATAALWPVVVRAQAERVRRIGVLMPFTRDDPEDRARVAAFEEALKGLGWVDGRNLKIDYRWFAGDAAKARDLARELVSLRPDLLLASATPGASAAKQATSSIPIVFVSVADPVGFNLVGNLAKPDGNATGFTFFEFSVGSKLLEALKQVAPKVVRVAAMFNPDTSPSAPYLRSIDAAAGTFGM